MANILLSIGSNIDPELNLTLCAQALERHFKNPQWSPVYRCPAVGMVGDDFLNAAVMTQSNQSIEEISHTLKLIEADQGRVRTADKYASRTLDIDLLLYDSTVLQTPDIVLPREEITSAAHVLKPLADLIPDELHPVIGKSYSKLLSEYRRQHPGSVENLHEIALKNVSSEKRNNLDVSNNE